VWDAGSSPSRGEKAIKAVLRIRDIFFPNPGSRIPNPYFRELNDNFLSKKFYNSLEIGPNFFFKLKKISFNFVIFVARKKGRTTIFFPLLFCCCLRICDMRSEIQIKIIDKKTKNRYCCCIYNKEG